MVFERTPTHSQPSSSPPSSFAVPIKARNPILSRVGEAKVEPARDDDGEWEGVYGDKERKEGQPPTQQQTAVEDNNPSHPVTAADPIPDDDDGQDTDLDGLLGLPSSKKSTESVWRQKSQRNSTSSLPRDVIATIKRQHTPAKVKKPSTPAHAPPSDDNGRALIARPRGVGIRAMKKQAQSKVGRSPSPNPSDDRHTTGTPRTRITRV